MESVGVMPGDMEGNVVEANEFAPRGDGNGSSVECSLARARAMDARELRENILLDGDCGAYGAEGGCRDDEDGEFRADWGSMPVDPPAVKDVSVVLEGWPRVGWDAELDDEASAAAAAAAALELAMMAATARGESGGGGGGKYGWSGRGGLVEMRCLRAKAMFALLAVGDVVGIHELR